MKLNKTSATIIALLALVVAIFLSSCGAKDSSTDYWSDTEARAADFLTGTGVDIPEQYHQFCIRMMEEALRQNNLAPTDEYQFKWAYSGKDNLLGIGSIGLSIKVGDTTYAYSYMFG